MIIVNQFFPTDKPDYITLFFGIDMTARLSFPKMNGSCILNPSYMPNSKRGRTGNCGKKLLDSSMQLAKV